MRRTDKADMISATEIASFVYCPEQWRLEYGLGLKPENQASINAGNQHHAQKAVAERIAGGAITAGRVLAVLAAVVLLLLLWRQVMSLPTQWIAVAAVLALLTGLWLILMGRGIRRRQGLDGGKTVSLDRVTLTSYHLGRAKKQL